MILPAGNPRGRGAVLTSRMNLKSTKSGVPTTAHSAATRQLADLTAALNDSRQRGPTPAHTTALSEQREASCDARRGARSSSRAKAWHRGSLALALGVHAGVSRAEPLAVYEVAVECGGTRGTRVLVVFELGGAVYARSRPWRRDSRRDNRSCCRDRWGAGGTADGAGGELEAMRRAGDGSTLVAIDTTARSE